MPGSLRPWGAAFAMGLLCGLGCGEEDPGAVPGAERCPGAVECQDAAGSWCCASGMLCDPAARGCAGCAYPSLLCAETCCPDGTICAAAHPDFPCQVQGAAPLCDAWARQQVTCAAPADRPFVESAFASNVEGCTLDLSSICASEAEAAYSCQAGDCSSGACDAAVNALLACAGG